MAFSNEFQSDAVRLLITDGALVAMATKPSGIGEQTLSSRYRPAAVERRFHGRGDAAECLTERPTNLA